MTSEVIFEYVDLAFKYVNYIIGGSAMVGAYPFYKKVIIPIIGFFRSILKSFDNLQIITNILGPNGGKSLYDKVTSIDIRLFNTEEQLKLMFRHLNIGKMKFNELFECTYASSELCRLIGRPETDFLQNNWLNLVSDHIEIHAAMFEIYKQRRTATIELTFKTGSDMISVYFTLQPLIDNSSFEGYLATISQKVDKK